MNAGLIHILRVLVDALEGPVVALLFVFFAGVLFELGLVAGELTRGLGRLRARGDVRAADAQARARVGRADVLARVGPMLGLMGTLIPLGPGLASLGRGDVKMLAASVTLAFDTTVLGLAIGAVGYAIGQLRRWYYGRLLDDLEGP
ncbi:MAG: MotA/TolQ/ExbB proton channel family protein [Myxococcota bacterium]